MAWHNGIGSFEPDYGEDTWVLVADDAVTYTLTRTDQGGHMKSIPFDVQSFCEGFGPAGRLVFDVESGAVAGSIKAFDLVLNAAGDAYEGTAVVRFVEKGATTPLTASTSAAISVRWIAPPGGVGCAKSITRYPFAMTITWTGADGKPASVLTNAMTLNNYGVLACPVCILDCTLTVG